MSKQTTVILIIVISTIVLAAGIFLLFFTAPPIQNENPQSQFSPFGNYTGSSSTTAPTSDTANTNADNQVITGYINNPSSPLIKISANPIAGAQVFDRKVSTTTTSIVRYIERATGHVTEYDKKANILTTTSNTTIPSIYQATWTGNTVLAQFLNQNKNAVRTFVATLPTKATSTTQLTGRYLADDIYTFAVSPKGDRVFTIPKGETAVGSILSMDGTKRTSILNFPFNEWNTQWPNETTITLTSKPSFSSLGYMYSLTTAGFMKKIIGNIAGLTTLTNPTLTYTIYSSSNDGGLSTAIYDLTKNTSLAFAQSPTLAEKCVWSKLFKTIAYCAIPTTIPIGNYPDAWYQGNVSFVDNIYKVDMNLQSVNLLYRLPTDQSIDAINLFLDTKEENLYFTNKYNYHLWGLSIKGL
jgi:hypothetical protein